jgi:glycosyltransferase involved in cell wall biosynthesis
VTARWDTKTKQLIDGIIKDKDLNEHVTFYGKKSPEELAGFFRSADLYVSSSRKEGFGLTVAESIACGTPVLSTKSGGPEEIITEETGKLTSIKNLDKSLKNTLMSLKKFNKQKLHMHIENNFSMHSKMEKLNMVYSSILN